MKYEYKIVARNNEIGFGGLSENLSVDLTINAFDEADAIITAKKLITKNIYVITDIREIQG